MTLQDEIAPLEPAAFAPVLDWFGGYGLLTPAEADEVVALFDPGFPLAGAVRAAASIHLHVKVPDVDALPHDEILATGARPTSGAEGHVKYPYPGGISMIFSSIPIAEDDRLGRPPSSLPMLDHKGIDLRDEAPWVRRVFDGVPTIATARGWRHVGQGGSGRPVYCCHTEVAEKHWVFPDAGDAGQRRPIELAFGALRVHGDTMGCDLRPLDPADVGAVAARLAQAPTCCAVPLNPTPGGS